MGLKDTSQKFGAVSKFFHWTISGLVIFQFFLVYWKHSMLEKNSDMASYFIAGLHKPLGTILLGLVLAWIVWRLFTKRPELLPMPLWQRVVARWVHIGLFTTVLIMPVTGVLMSAAAGFPADVFGLFKTPVFAEPNKALAMNIHEIHEWVSYGLIGLLAIHVGAALLHHYYNKDDTLKRMLP